MDVLFANARHGLAHAEAGFKAMQAALAAVTPSTALAEQHRKQAEPGSAR